MEFARPPLLHRALVGLVLVLLVTRLAATKATVATVERRDGSTTAALDKAKPFSLATDGNEPMVRGDNNGGDTHLAAATFPLQLTGATTVFYFGSNPTPSPIALHVASASKGIVLLARIYPLPTAATGSGSPAGDERPSYYYDLLDSASFVADPCDLSRCGRCTRVVSAPNNFPACMMPVEYQSSTLYGVSGTETLFLSYRGQTNSTAAVSVRAPVTVLLVDHADTLAGGSSGSSATSAPVVSAVPSSGWVGVGPGSMFLGLAASAGADTLGFCAGALGGALVLADSTLPSGETTLGRWTDAGSLGGYVGAPLVPLLETGATSGGAYVVGRGAIQVLWTRVAESLEVEVTTETGAMSLPADDFASLVGAIRAAACPFIASSGTGYEAVCAPSPRLFGGTSSSCAVVTQATLNALPLLTLTLGTTGSSATVNLAPSDYLSYSGHSRCFVFNAGSTDRAVFGMPLFRSFFFGLPTEAGDAPAAKFVPAAQACSGETFAVEGLDSVVHGPCGAVVAGRFGVKVTDRRTGAPAQGVTVTYRVVDSALDGAATGATVGTEPVAVILGGADGEDGGVVVTDDNGEATLPALSIGDGSCVALAGAAKPASIVLTASVSGAAGPVAFEVEPHSSASFAPFVAVVGAVLGAVCACMAVSRWLRWRTEQAYLVAQGRVLIGEDLYGSSSDDLDNADCHAPPGTGEEIPADGSGSDDDLLVHLV